MTSPTPVIIWVDPGCPWCFQTARWMRRLEADGVVDLSWAFLPLEVHNSDDRRLDLDVHVRTVPAMRVALLVRDEHGQAAAGRFYEAIAGRQHHRDEQLKRPETMRTALLDVGLDEGLVARALDDPTTAERLEAEYRIVVDRVIGVPTLELDAPGGPMIFGPVIAELPDGDAARDLWAHVEWLTRDDNVFELKRVRDVLPDLEGIRLAQARRSARAAGAVEGLAAS